MGKLKKNFVFIYIDSFSATILKDERKFEKYAPFLYSLSKKSLYIDEMYSQGPFTEAGSNGLLTGDDALADNGYMYRIAQGKDNLFFKQKRLGYKNNIFYIASSLYSKEILDSFDKKYIIGTMNFHVFWLYRILHFKKKYDMKVIDQFDYETVKVLLEYIFMGWLDYLDEADNKDYEMIKKLHKDASYSVIRKRVETEYERYSNNPVEYINEIFKQERNHPLFSIDDHKNIKFVTKEFIQKELVEKNARFMKDVRRKQIKQNLFSYQNIKAVIKGDISTLKNFRFLTFKATKAIDQNELFYHHIMPSLDTQLKKLAKEIINIKDGNNFFYCQAEDLHGAPNFYSYDTDDEVQFQKELDKMKTFIHQLDRSDKGNILYYMSLNYVDNAIKEFFEQLEENGKLDDIRIVVTTDHGSSVIYDPIRSKVVNNFYIENYNIPLWIYDNDFKPKKIHKKFSSKHVTHFMNLTEDEIISYIDHVNDEILVEYFGPGCPDIRENAIWYGLYQDNYFIGARCKLAENFNINHIDEIYDLYNDKKQIKNIRSQFDAKKLENVMRILQTRHQNLQEQYRYIYEK